MKAEIAERIRLINKGQVPEGYKKSKVGIIPIDWEEGQIRNYIDKLEAGVSVNSVNGEFINIHDKNKYVLKTSSVVNGIFKPNEAKLIDAKDIQRARLNPLKNSILISRMNTPELVGECALVKETYDNLYLPDRLWMTKYTDKESDARWLTYILCYPKYRRMIKDAGTGTSSTMKNIAKDALLDISIPLVDSDEQQKIASTLSTWDKAIELKEKLISEKKKQKTALMQELLTGKKRLDDFDGEWEKMKLGEASIIKKGKALSSKNIKEGHYPVIAGGKTSPYSHNEFTDENVITVSASGAYAGYVSFYKMKIWASDCTVIKEKPNKTIIDFLFFFMTYKQDDVYVLQTGGAQPHIYPKDLENIYISLPSIPEQTAIANILSLADKEISLLEKELQALKEQKKGLMQLLLTGIVRVN